MKKSFCQATRHLITCDPAWAELIPRIGPCGLSPKPGREPYEALIRAIAYQQLHVRAAETILKRFIDLYPNRKFPSPREVLDTDVSRLRNSGFSSAKIASIRSIAENTIKDVVPSRREALGLSDRILIERLTAIRGVGQWTVEMLMIFTLERPDILPVADFGVREGWRLMKALDKQPTPRQMRDVGEGWRPYRSTATWYLWQVTKQAKEKAVTKKSS